MLMLQERPIQKNKKIIGLNINKKITLGKMPLKIHSQLLYDNILMVNYLIRVF